LRALCRSAFPRPTFHTFYYLNRHLQLAHEAAKDEPEELARIDMLQRIFLDHLPNTVLAELEEARRMELTGSSLVRRLEALRERRRLNPSEPSDAGPAHVEVMRIVCSDGLV